MMYGSEEPLGTLDRVMTLGEASGIEFDWRSSCGDIFTEYTDLPVFDSAIKNPHNEAVASVCVPPLDWLRLQMGAAESFGGGPATTSWLREPVERVENTQDMVQKIRSGSSDIPRPILELDRDGNITGFQEGRNRGVAAYYAGVDFMPVYFILDQTQTGGKLFLRPPHTHQIREYLNQRRSEVLA